MQVTSAYRLSLSSGVAITVARRRCRNQAASAARRSSRRNTEDNFERLKALFADVIPARILADFKRRESARFDRADILHLIIAY